MADPFADLTADIVPGRDVTPQATSEALTQTGPEVSEVGFQPIDSATFQRTPTKPEPPLLDKQDLSQPFIDDVRLAMIRSTGKDINPHSLGRTPREVLTNAVAQQALGVGYEPPADQGALSGYWNRFRAEMQPPVLEATLGAIGRGAKEAIGATIGGILGGAAGSTAGGVGAFGGAYIGGKLGAEAQETLFPPTAEDVAQAMFDFQIPPTRYGRMLGNYLPSLLTAKPVDPRTLTRPDVINSLIAASAPSALRIVEEGVKGVRAGKEIGEIAEEALDPQRTLEQLAFDAAFALASKPNAAGKWLMDKQYRTERTARQRASEALVQAAGGEGPALAAAEKIAYNEPMLVGNGVQIGSGDLSQNVGLVGLQGAIERRNQESLGQRRISSLRQVGVNLGEALATESPKSSDYLAYQFKGQNEAAIQQLAKTRDMMIEQGNAAAADRLSQALAQIDIAGQEARNFRITQEQAYAQTTAALQSATEALMQNLGMTTKEQANIAVADRFKTNKATVLAEVEKAYQDAAKSGAVTDFKNTFTAAVKASRARSVAAEAAGVDLSPRIKGIIEAFAPDAETGQRQLFPISQLQKVLSEVSEAIREEPDKNLMEKRLLGQVKDGLMADLDAAGQVSEPVRKANAAYKDYADRFLNETATGILQRDPATMIDQYMQTPGVREIRRLRSALIEPGSDAMTSRGVLAEPIVDNLTTYMLNSLANRQITTSKQLTQWMKSNDGTRFLETFPESKPRMQAVIDGIAKASADVEAAFAADKAAEKQYELNVAQLRRDQAAKERLAARQERMTERVADEQYAREVKRIESEAAQRFIAADPITAFSEVLSSRDPVNGVKNLANRAFQDPTGGAVEALKQTAREWVNQTMRNAGKALIDNLDPKKKVDVNELRVSGAKLTDLLAKGPIAEALSVVLSPKELQALNLAQRQLIAMEQRIGLSAGESATRLNTMSDMTLEQGLADNLLSGLFRIMRSADPTYKKQNATFINSALSVVQKVWKGDVPALASEFLKDAMTNPQIAIEALRDPKANPARSQMVLKNWLLFHNRNAPYEALPFSVQNTSVDELPNGLVYKDTKYGYSIYRTPQNKYRLVDPFGKVSIHDTFNDAENKANNKHLRSNATP